MYIIGVEGMSCMNCVTIIESSIKSLDKDAEVGVDLLKKEVRVETLKGPQEIRDLLENKGYDVISLIEQ